MADEKPETPAAADPAANASGWSEGAKAEGSELEAQKAEIARLAAENADVKDRLLRSAAEMENLRRRTEREVADSRQYAVTAFAREIVAVGDNLARALSSLSEEARSAAEGPVASLIEGVAMTERELLKVLGKHGVKRIDPTGERFDPNVHQAMFEVPNPDVPSGTVVQVVQPGYVIGERVLRPAMVGVSKGGPKAAKVESAGAEGGDSRSEAEGRPGVDRTV